jgi:hypothetical protein
MSVEFFKTMMGRKFFEADLPRLTKALENLGGGSDIDALAEKIYVENVEAFTPSRAYDAAERFLKHRKERKQDNE